MTRTAGALVACALMIGAAAWWLGDGGERPREVVDVVTPTATGVPAERDVVDAVTEPDEPERLVAPTASEAAVARDDDAWLATGARLVTVRGTVAYNLAPTAGVEVRVVNGLTGGFDASKSGYELDEVSSASPDLAPFGARSDAIGHGRWDPVSIARLTDLAPRRATSGADGAFAARAPLSDGAWLVLTHADGAVCIERLDVDDVVTATDGVPTLDVGSVGHALRLCVRVFGDVVDEEGAPLEGVEVSVALTSDLCMTTVTDAAGHYEFASVPRSFRVVRFVCAGRPERRHEVSFRTGGERIEAPGGGLDAIAVDTIRFEPTGTRRGRVLGPDGAPPPRAEVLATPYPVTGLDARRSRRFEDDDDSILFELECDVTWPTRRALTDVDGRFTLEGLELDETYTLYARAPGLEPARLADVEPEGDDELLFELSRRDRLFVDVVDGDGVPVDGAKLRAWRVGHARGAGRPIEVRSHGARFEVLGTGTQKTRLVVDAPGFAEQNVELEGRVGSVDGETTTVVLEPRILLTAEVRDERGRPVRTYGDHDLPLEFDAFPRVGAWLWDGMERRVGDDGRVAWRSLGPGEYVVDFVSRYRSPVRFVDALRPDPQTVVLSHAHGDRHVVFVVRSTGTLEGRLVGDGGVPIWERIEFVPVVIPGAAGDELPEARVITPGNGDRAEFSAALRPGTWRVVVDGEDAGVHTVVAGATTSIEVPRAAAIRVTVRVLDADGAPLVDARVTRHDTPEAERRETDDDGRITWTVARPGLIELSVRPRRARGFVDHHATFDVARETDAIEWVVSIGRLRGRVHGVEAGGTLSFHGREGELEAWLYVRDDGTFEHDMPPGDYVARFSGSPGLGAVGPPFTVEAGRVTELELTARPGVAVSGSVWRDDPDAVKAACVVAWRIDEPCEVHVETPWNYDYGFDTLPPGRYRIAGFVDDLTGALGVLPTQQQRNWLAVAMAHVPITEVGDEPLTLDLPGEPIDARP